MAQSVVGVSGGPGFATTAVVCPGGMGLAHAFSSPELKKSSPGLGLLALISYIYNSLHMGLAHMPANPQNYAVLFAGGGGPSDNYLRYYNSLKGI
jgi:hypothetical protein